MMNKKLITFIKNNPVKLAHLLGFEDMGELHNKWLKKMVFGKADMTLQAHRNSYKTTTLSLAIALIMVLYPHKTILFMRKTDDDVIEIIKQVTNILESNLFSYIIDKIYGISLAFREKSSTKLDTILKTNATGTPQLLGIGTGASLTGKHFDIIITDDIINMKDRVSRAERERTKLIYMELQNIKKKGGRFINTGTPWHKEDAFLLMPNIERYDIYSTGIFTKEEIQNIRSSMTPSLYSANYELKHIADADALFKNPHFFKDDKLLYDGVTHIDASYGGEDGTAITFIKQMDGKYYVLGKRQNKHVDDCLNEVYLLHKKLRSGTIYCEMNGDKGYLKKEIKNDGYLCKGYTEKMNKYVKISTYLRKNWDNIYFHEDTDPTYLSEILDYTENAQHDDSPDSLASIIRELNKSQWLV